MMTIRNSDYPFEDPFDTRSMGRQIVNRKQEKEKKGCGIFWFIGIFWLIMMGILIWFFSTRTGNLWIWILVTFFGLFILASFVKGSKIPKLSDEEQFLVDMEEVKKGNVKAMVNVGLAYWRGEGVEKNLKEAKHWLTRAVELGDRWAPTMLKRFHKNPNKPF
ncbi:MAG: hypothetical protein FWC39_07760 [Bacteroidetes bacterium]|nr:hypothetical protein [Bacteroidota bacterium]